MRRILIITLLLLPGIYAAAQQFPVQVTPQLLPPYTLQVSEYSSPGAAGAKLNLLLLLRDFNKPTLQVRLRMSIEGQSVSVRSREDAVFTPITIESGIPKYIEPSELEEYFNSNNLEFSGMTRQQYELTGKLPEGFYSFCFEVIEAGTNLVVSNKGCAMAWMTLSEPPLLNIPRKAEALIPTTPQNVLFQWTPRHTASPNAYNTEYVFSIVELLDDAIAPEAAFLSNSPLYVDSTNLTTYLYDVTKPALIAGKKYAWRVQVKAKNGLQDLAMFRNGGYSETFWFTYQNNCAVPVGIGANPQGQIVGISWTHNIDHLDYKVEYREKNNPGAVWFEIGNTIPRVNISDLKYSTIYEYRVGGACEYGKFIFAPLQQFTTNDSLSSTVANCGVDPNLTGTNAPPIQLLNPGDTIKAGDFDVIATKVTGSQPSFSGEGYVAVSWLANMKLAVRFTNITVGTDKKLKTGIIETTYDPTEGGIASIDAYFEGGDAYGQIKNGLDTADHKVNFVISSPDDIDVVTGAGYDPITGQGPVTITITGSNNENLVITVNELPVTIKDADGNIYQANKDGTVTSIGKAGGQALIDHSNVHEVDTAKGVVRFMNYPGKQVFGFDEYKPAYEKSSAFRSKYEKLKGGYYVPAKATAAGKTDYLKAKITLNDPSLVPDSVKFVSSKGIIYQPKKLSADEFEIPVVGAPAGDGIEILALYSQPGNKTLNLGKILVASYPEKIYTVKVVPVNGATADIEAIKTTVNQAFKQANVKFNISSDDNFQNSDWDLNGDNKMDVDSAGAFRSYTAEMRKLHAHYKKARPVEANTYYIFLVNQANVPGVQGDMPRAGKFGYIFTNTLTDFGRTAAHELGHGAAVLKHIFDGEGFDPGDLPDNLMDIGSGTHLTKHQWDYMHDPPFTTSLLDADEDAFSEGDTLSAEINGVRTYITPSGTPVKLPAGYKVRLNKVADYDLIPNGALYWFESPTGQQYAAKMGYYRLRVVGGAMAVYVENDFSGYYPVVNGAIDNTQPAFNGFETPDIIDNKTQVIVLYEIKMPDHTCLLKRFIAEYNIPQDAGGSKLNFALDDLQFPDPNPILPRTVECSDPYPDQPVNDFLDKYFEKHGKKLQAWLDKKVKSDIKFYLFDCVNNRVKYTVTKDGAAPVDANMQDKLLEEYNSGKHDVGIKACIDPKGKWEYDIKISEKVWDKAHPKMKEARAEVEAEIKKQIEEEVKNKKRYDAIIEEGTPEYEQQVGAEGKFYKENMGFLKSLGAFIDVGKHVISDGQMPDYLWDDGERSSGTPDPKIAADYQNSPLKMPSPLSGGTDQFIEEVTGAVQLVKTGYEFVRRPKPTFEKIWTGIKELDGEKIKKMAKSMSGWDNYEQGGVRARYQGGKHAVQITMIVFTGIKNLAKGSDMIKEGGDQFKKLDDFVVGNKSDEIGGVFDNARMNKAEIKTIGDDKMITTNVENSSTKIKVVEKKGGDDADVFTFDDDDLIDTRDPTRRADIDEIESGMKETDFPNTPNGNEITAQGGGKGNWNKGLNKPEANKLYNVDNNFKYKTNQGGLVDEVDVAELKIDIKRDRNFYQQKKARESGAQGATDDGGHLIASRFNGPGEKINIVPMGRATNRSGGKWYELEEKWSKFLENPNNKIEGLKIKIDYDANGRPAKFTVSWKENGTQLAPIDIPNL